LLVAFIPDWRWRYCGETTSWYDSMRIFRQTVRGDWDGVVAAVCQSLEGPFMPD
jgi:hypothetical protein